MATYIHILTCLRTKSVALIKERKKNCLPLLFSTSASGEAGVYQGHAVGLENLLSLSGLACSLRLFVHVLISIYLRT